jgi:hypothetical protein
VVSHSSIVVLITAHIFVTAIKCNSKSFLLFGWSPLPLFPTATEQPQSTAPNDSTSTVYTTKTTPRSQRRKSMNSCSRCRFYKISGKVSEKLPRAKRKRKLNGLPRFMMRNKPSLLRGTKLTASPRDFIKNQILYSGQETSLGIAVVCTKDN